MPRPELRASHLLSHLVLQNLGGQCWEAVPPSYAINKEAEAQGEE